MNNSVPQSYPQEEGIILQISEPEQTYGTNPSVNVGETPRTQFRRPIKHSYCRRKFDFDYKAPWVYFVTFKSTRGLPDLSVLRGDVSRPGSSVYAEPTAIGKIFLGCLEIFLARNQMIKSDFKVVMPDHVHIIFRVVERLERDFGWYLGQLFSSCTSCLRKMYPIYGESGMSYFVKDNYNDKILFRAGQWRKWQYYIADNPRRALMRKTFPDLFQRTMAVIGKLGNFPTYGNLYLLRYPEKVIVRYTSKLSEEDNVRNLNNACRLAEEGYVLVSPFIHPREEAVYKMGLKRGWKMIRIIEFGLPVRKHPYKEEFNYCATGRYLLVSLKTERTFERRHPSREVCMRMNDFACAIVTDKFECSSVHLE